MMLQSESKIEEILARPEMKAGLNKYKWLLNNLHQVDISVDREYRRRYNGFFRVRQREQKFYDCYYSLLQSQKNNKELTYQEILTYIWERTGRLEKSFSSKLLSIIDTDKPVWDKFVLQNLNLKEPYQYDKKRLQKTIALYEDICGWYTQFLASEEARQTIILFDKKFPDNGISNTKKIDLILWQTR